MVQTPISDATASTQQQVQTSPGVLAPQPNSCRCPLHLTTSKANVAHQMPCAYHDQGFNRMHTSNTLTRVKLTCRNASSTTATSSSSLPTILSPHSQNPHCSQCHPSRLICKYWWLKSKIF